jgi:hypothetical protein
MPRARAVISLDVGGKTTASGKPDVRAGPAAMKITNGGKQQDRCDVLGYHNLDAPGSRIRPCVGTRKRQRRLERPRDRAS